MSYSKILAVVLLLTGLWFITTETEPKINYPVIAKPERAEAKVKKAPCPYGTYIAMYFPKWEWKRACKVMKYESGYRRYARSRTNDHGLFQINWRYHAWRFGWCKWKIYNPKKNIKVASQIWKRNGWCAWTVGRHLGYCHR